MNTHDLSQFIVFAALVSVLAVPLGHYLMRVFTGQPIWLERVFGPLERLIYRLADVKVEEEHYWLNYAAALLIFNALGAGLLFLLLSYQNYLPWNPQQLPGLAPDLAFNVTVSFITNTNWQSYSGETTLSYFSQMVGLTVQNFLSAATGLAVAIALIRALTRREQHTLGNFYVDMTRTTLYVLLPIAFVVALVLIQQGVPENMHAYVTATTLEHATQTIPEGPVASQIAIKQIGTNGGGFFNANSAHPYENPTPLSNLIEMICIVLLPAALVISFGKMVGDRRQGRALMVSMTVLFLGSFLFCYLAEAHGNPAFTAFGVDQTISKQNPGGNMEGKEVRFGILNSTLWATLTTATSNGSVNAMHDSFTPLGGLVPLFNILLGEVIYGGVGCGLYGILIYVMITVFIAGLMVGRTPEYLGKKIEAREIKLAVLAMMLYPTCILGLGVASLLIPEALKSISNAGPHGLTQVIYTYASAAGNNGSAFAGFNANTFYQNIVIGIVILIGRFGIILPVLAIAGSLVTKKITPISNGTFPTHGPMFIILLTSIIILFGGLTYFPALALGPIAEQFSFSQPPTQP